MRSIFSNWLLLARNKAHIGTFQNIGVYLSVRFFLNSHTRVRWWFPAPVVTKPSNSALNWSKVVMCFQFCHTPITLEGKIQLNVYRFDDLGRTGLEKPCIDIKREIIYQKCPRSLCLWNFTLLGKLFCYGIKVTEDSFENYLHKLFLSQTPRKTNSRAWYRTIAIKRTHWNFVCNCCICCVCNSLRSLRRKYVTIMNTFGSYNCSSSIFRCWTVQLHRQSKFRVNQ